MSILSKLKSVVKWTLIGIGALVALFIVLAVAFSGGDDAGDAPEPETNGDAESAPTDTEADSNTHEVGETFTVGDSQKQVDYTVNGIETQTVEGETFIAVSVTMKNTGKETVDVTSNQFSLVDSQDREFDTDRDAMIYGEDSISFEQLQPGLDQEGVVYFKVPDTEDNFEFVVEPVGIFSSADEQSVEVSV
jgi:hypothetical protein